MRWPEALRPVRMSRIAIVAPGSRLRETLVQLADAGAVELEELAQEGVPAASAEPEASLVPPEAADAGLEGDIVLPAEAPRVTPRIVAAAPDLEELRRERRWDVLAGEAELRRAAARALRHRGAAVLLGWTPHSELPTLSAHLAPAGAAVVELPTPPTVEAPTLIRERTVSRPFRPLVETYGTVPYADVDPTLFAGASYVLMFGMMFGDVAHGLILSALGIYLRRTRRPNLAGLRPGAALATIGGLAAAFFGLLYGEAFGPTRLIPVLWLAPLGRPLDLLAAAAAIGAALIAMSYVIGAVNRWREGGPGRALYASSGIAGGCFYFGAAASAAGWYLGQTALLAGGLTIVGVGVALLFVGFLAAAGGGTQGVVEALVEVFDAVIRTAANTVSFTRLAAFGMTHAAIGGVVWAGTVTLWGSGWLGVVGAVVLFSIGNLLAFALEALVAAVQALRLEYYELFSRIATGEGRVFSPWHVPIAAAMTPSAEEQP
jgi:V/A-type H+-transporting ATPase subunit I